MARGSLPSQGGQAVRLLKIASPLPQDHWNWGLFLPSHLVCFFCELAANVCIMRQGRLSSQCASGNSEGPGTLSLGMRSAPRSCRNLQGLVFVMRI